MQRTDNCVQLLSSNGGRAPADSPTAPGGSQSGNVAAAELLGLGLLHTATGGWTVPIVVLLALLVVQLVAGVAASRDRHVLAPR